MQVSKPLNSLGRLTSPLWGSSTPIAVIVWMYPCKDGIAISPWTPAPLPPPKTKDNAAFVFQAWGGKALTLSKAQDMLTSKSCSILMAAASLFKSCSRQALRSHRHRQSW